jgi:hypothetical protein
MHKVPLPALHDLQGFCDPEKASFSMASSNFVLINWEAFALLKDCCCARATADHATGTRRKKLLKRQSKDYRCGISLLTKL